MPQRASISRRTLFKAGAGLALPVIGGSSAFAAANPPLVPLEAKPGEAALLGGGKPKTGIWGFNGATPGPVLRVKRGERVRAQLVNSLPQPTTIHWHGIRIDNAMDGVPHMTQHAVMPGAVFDYDFIAPDAGTYWFHPHERSYEQVARGLFGALIVEEPDPPAADQDIVLVINDWRLGSDGAFSEKTLGSAHDRAHAGRLGNTFTVNGLPPDAFPARLNERLRIRLINASSARILNLRFENGVAKLIAIDGQPVGPTTAYGSGLILAPGNRAEVMLDIIGSPGHSVPLIEATGDKRVELARFVAGEAAPIRPEPLAAPIELKANGVPEPKLDGALTVDLVMTGGAMNEMDMSVMNASVPAWQFNGVAGMGAEPLFRIARGRTVLLRMNNDTAWPHAMHVHGHHARIVERNGETAADSYLWDTVLMQPREKVTIAIAADNPGKWMIHCHMLDHQAAGMDTWFVVAA